MEEILTSLEFAEVLPPPADPYGGWPLIDDNPGDSLHITTRLASVRERSRTLAHRGVLFLDELPEFTRPALEALRQPLEDGEVVVARAAGAVRMPARCTVVAAMNPCPCGRSGDPELECTCPPRRLDGYRARVSGPLRDRFDLHVEVPRLAGQYHFVLKAENGRWPARARPTPPSVAAWRASVGEAARRRCAGRGGGARVVNATCSGGETDASPAGPRARRT